MGGWVCPYCLEPCGMMGDGCADKGLPEKPEEEVRAAVEKYWRENYGYE